jgi:hypothetical protein
VLQKGERGKACEENRTTERGKPMNTNSKVTEQEIENYFRLKWALAILERVRTGQGRHDWELPAAIRQLEKLRASLTEM